MPAVTGTELAQDAFALLNVFLPGESIGAADGAYALRALNDLLSEIANRVAFIPMIARLAFPMVTSQGGVASGPYTIGIGGNFNVQKPANQQSLSAANLILTTSSPTVRIPLGIYTDDAYDANAIPDLSNLQPTGLYYLPNYNPTGIGDLGSIFLWPVPSVNYNLLEIFVQSQVAQFADLSTTYFVPDGWKKFLKYNLADLLQTPYGKQLSQAAQRIAVSSAGTVKRANWSRLTDVVNDASSWTQDRQSFYNIDTGNGGA